MHDKSTIIDGFFSKCDEARKKLQDSVNLLVNLLVNLVNSVNYSLQKSLIKGSMWEEDYL